MVRYESDGVFDGPMEKVWQLLEEHGDPEKVKEHHPSTLSLVVLEEGDGWDIVEKTEETPQGPTTTKLKNTMNPPSGFTTEFLSGPLEGAMFEHTYEGDGDRTHVTVVGDVPVPEGMTEEELLGMVDGMLTRAHEEDQRALKRL